MSSLKENTNVVKLNAQNYSIWKFRMEMLLIKEDLYDLVETGIPEGADEKILKRDKQARALINLCIEDSQIIHVKYETTAKGTWEKLKSIHERINLSSKLFLLRKLYSTKLSEDGNMLEHIANISQIIDKLRSIGEIIKDEHHAALLLISVPKSYDHLIMALETRPETELTPDLIINKLSDEYQKRKELIADRNTYSSQAYKINEKQRCNPNPNKFKQNQFKNDKYCNYCRRKGHNTIECFHLRNNKNQYNPQRFQRRNENHSYKPNEKSSACFHTDSDRRLLTHENKQKQNATPLITSFRQPYRRPQQEIINMEAIENRIEVNRKANKCMHTHLNESKQMSFILDSGSSKHMVFDECAFIQLNKNIEPMTVKVANGQCLYSQGVGEIKTQLRNRDGSTQDIILKEVYLIPELESNLISVKKITEKGYKVTFEEDRCVIKGNNTYIEVPSKENNLYTLDTYRNIDDVTNVTNAINNHHGKNCLQLWHRRMGHRNNEAIKQLIKNNLARGITLDKCCLNRNTDCSECIKNKLTERPYPKKSTSRATKPLMLIHSDIQGPMKTPTIGGKHYILTFIDDYSRFTVTYLIAHKNEALSKFKEYVAMTRNKFGRTVRTLRTDNGGEYVNREFEEFMKQGGIKHQLTVPFSPSENGTAERKNRSLIEMTRCLLGEGNLPHRFWGEAVQTATYIQNRLPTKANLITPFELWTGFKPNVSHLKTYGCKAFALLHKSKRSKLDEKTVEGIFVGYDVRSKGYRIYTTGDNIIISRSVRFIETKENTIEIPIISETGPIVDEKEEVVIPETPHQPVEEIETRRISKRTTKGQPPDRFSYNITAVKEPKSYKDLEQFSPEEKGKWEEAMKEEIESLEKNNTWELANLPENKKAIGCKWTYKLKLNEMGEIERYKARLVAKGFSQKYGSDFDETFAPVVKYTTIRAFLAAACHKEMYTRHIDVKTAFLHGELKEEIYMQQPPGITQKDKNKVLKLKKSIYGLKQAAKAWNEKIGNSLSKIGFRQSEADPCLFIKGKDEETVYAIVYVDDILLSSKHEEAINHIINELRKEFEIKDLNEVNYYLGIIIQRTKEGNFLLNQRNKIEKLYNDLEEKYKKPTYTPMSTTYGKDENNQPPLKDNSLYRKSIGTLLYISTLTRPDIALAVNLLSRKNENPSEEDWKAVTQVIRYLHTTKDLNLKIDRTSAPTVTAYCDADWANDTTDRTSTAGNLFLLGTSPISWCVKRQNCVALSSTEAEFISASLGAKEIVWLNILLKDLGLRQTLPIKLYEDNKSCITLAENNKFNNRSKHIDVKYHHIRNLQHNNIIKLIYCNTKLMTADILTKALPRPRFEFLRQKMNLIMPD